MYAMIYITIVLTTPADSLRARVLVVTPYAYVPFLPNFMALECFRYVDREWLVLWYIMHQNFPICRTIFPISHLKDPSMIPPTDEYYIWLPLVWYTHKDVSPTWSYPHLHRLCKYFIMRYIRTPSIKQSYVCSSCRDLNVCWTIHNWQVAILKVQGILPKLSFAFEAVPSR